MTRSRFAVAIAAASLGVVFALGACGGSDGSGASGSKKAKGEVQKFLDELDAAVRDNNVDFRVARLNPAVIDRYGERQCRDFLAGQQDSTRRDKVKSVGKPESFEYATDTQSATIADATPVQVRETVKGKKGDRNLHLARINGQFTYFIDCGEPLMRQ